MTDETRQSPADPVSHDDTDRMVKIEKLISDLQAIKDRFGNTCVYIRRGGLSWGAVALNRRDDDEKNGVFDLQAQHDRDMIARVGQVERLIEARNRAQQEGNELRRLVCTLSSHLTDEGDDYSTEGLDAMRRRVANALPRSECPDWLHEYRDADVVAFPAPLTSSHRPEGS